LADIDIKRGDTWPPLIATLQKKGPPVEPLDLTGCTVRLILKTASAGSTAIIRVVTITDAAAGKVRWDWLTADTATVNTYQGEFEITFPNGTIGTVPNVGFFSVAVGADLG